MVSAVDLARRAFVVVLRSLASAYRCSVNATRDSSDAEVRKAYRAISRRTHPDHGGSIADQQKLNDAYDSWCQASRNRGRAGRPSTQQQAEQQQQQQGGLAVQPAEETDGSSAFTERKGELQYAGSEGCGEQRAQVGECTSKRAAAPFQKFVSFCGRSQKLVSSFL